MRVERLPAWEALGAATWHRLLEASATRVPFLSWAFQTLWWRFWGVGDLWLVGVQDGSGEWVAALPLHLVETVHGPVLRLVGGTELADYLDALVRRGREEEAWKAVLGALARWEAPALDLRPVPAGSPTVRHLPELTPAAGLTCRVEVEERCPVVTLPGSWDAYLAQLAGKDRHELRRKLRRAESARPRVEATRTAAGVAAAFDTFLALHRKSSAGKARFMDARMEAFFRALAAALAAEGMLALWILWLDERPAASVLCLEYGEVVALYNSGFDPELRALSPGVVLIARTLQDAVARGFRRYDFLRGREPYKYGFGAVDEDVLRVRVGRP